MTLNSCVVVIASQKNPGFGAIFPLAQSCKETRKPLCTKKKKCKAGIHFLLALCQSPIIGTVGSNIIILLGQPPFRDKKNSNCTWMVHFSSLHYRILWVLNRFRHFNSCYPRDDRAYEAHPHAGVPPRPCTPHPVRHTIKSQWSVLLTIRKSQKEGLPEARCKRRRSGAMKLIYFKLESPVCGNSW